MFNANLFDQTVEVEYGITMSISNTRLPQFITFNYLFNSTLKQD